MQPTPVPYTRDPMETENDSRRGFLRALLGLLAAAIAGIVSIPVVGAALSPLLAPPRREPGRLSPAGLLADLLVNVPKRVDLVSTVLDGWTRSDGIVGAVWLMKKPDGTVSALSPVCPHSGCSINLGAKETFSCPCHASAFTLEGKPLTGPSPRSMDPLEVVIRDQQILVRFARFKTGTSAREEI